MFLCFMNSLTPASTIASTGRTIAEPPALCSRWAMHVWNLRLRVVRWALVLSLGCAAGLPALAQLQVAVLNSAPASFQLGWQELGPTRAYTVQYRDTLGEAIWLNAPHLAPWPVTESFWTEPRTNPAAARFYRVLSVERPHRGEIIASELIEAMSAADVTLLMSLAGIPLTAQYGAGVFKLNYETIDPRGGRALASGLFVLPLGASGALPLLSYQHGTLVLTNEAPSADLFGEALVGKDSGLGLTIVGAVMGSTLFRLLVAIALMVGLNPNDLKLITAACVFFALITPGTLAKLKKKRARYA